MTYFYDTGEERERNWGTDSQMDSTLTPLPPSYLCERAVVLCYIEYSG